MAGEFALIDKYFARPTPSAILGPGDDCALVQPTPGKQLAVTTDMLVEGTHFLPDTDPGQLGWKTLAVNLSDLAAMGAAPLHALLTLGLPRETPVDWLDGFLDGFRAAAREQGVVVVGGDLTASLYEAAWREVLGRVPDDADVAALAGAPDGAEIKAKGSEYGSVVVTWTLPGIGTASRTFYPSDSGRPTIQAAYFELDENQRGKGLGAEMFGRTVDAGIRLGFDRIVTHAARSKSHNGYAVWPLFGYDGPLPESTRQRLPESLANARNVSDLMRTEEGRTWWSRNGHDINLTFSLRPRSKSLRIWNAYRAAKAAIEATRRTSPGRTGR